MWDDRFSVMHILCPRTATLEKFQRLYGRYRRLLWLYAAMIE